MVISSTTSDANPELRSSVAQKSTVISSTTSDANPELRSSVARKSTVAVNTTASLVRHFQRHPSAKPSQRIHETQDQLLLDDLIENRLPAYFATYDGEEAVPENLRELTTNVYDEEKFTMTVPEGEVPFEEFYKTVERIQQEGATVRVENIVKHPDGLEYHIHADIPEQFEGAIRAVAKVENGKIVRLEPQFHTNKVKNVLAEEDGVAKIYEDEEEDEFVGTPTGSRGPFIFRLPKSRSPMNPAAWSPEPRDKFYTAKDYIRDVARMNDLDLDANKISSVPVKKRWFDDDMVGLTLEEKDDGDVYIASIEKGPSALSVIQKSAFNYRDVQPGDRILAINGVYNIRNVEHAETLIKESDEVSLIIYHE